MKKVEILNTFKNNIKDINAQAVYLIEVTGGSEYVYKRRKGIQSSQFAN